VAIVIIFVPALTRGDKVIGQDEMVQFLASGSSLQLLEGNLDMDLTGHCSPLMVSFTAKTIPYNMLNKCTIDVWGMKGLPGTLDRILAYNDPGVAEAAEEGKTVGPGSNYLLELYLFGGVGAIIVGSLLFGFTSRCFMQWIGQRSLFSGIWAECLSRALFAPRGNLGYVYERIPSLVLATEITVLVVWMAYTLSNPKQQS
jgi:hypothetical protein